MAEVIPLFPLPNVVLFPNVFLPLHIFEPRYLDMVGDSLAADRLIGMVLLRPGWEHLYEGRPPVYPVGCSGVITHADRLSDGRYNIVLRGVERFRILGEDHQRSYRLASVEAFREPALALDDRAALQRQRTKLEGLIAPVVEHDYGRGHPIRGARGGGDPMIPSEMADEDLVNALAQYLDFEPIEKQALLERRCVRSRAESLVELLEMKLIAARGACGSLRSH
jgi:Lon protease-like protein